MKIYKNTLTGDLVPGNEVIGKWTDGSDMTVEEHVKIVNNGVYQFHEEINETRVSEVFDLATRIMVAHAQAGIKPIVSDAFEVAIQAYKVKDSLIKS